MQGLLVRVGKRQWAIDNSFLEADLVLAKGKELVTDH